VTGGAEPRRPLRLARTALHPVRFTKEGSTMDCPVTSRRSLLAALGIMSVGAGLSRRAAGQPGPAGRAIVGFPPGGTADIVTRMYVERLRTSLSRQLIVDNRPGAGGRLALDTLKPLPADGSAFVVTPASMLTIYPHLYARTLRYDPTTDFTPVTPVCVFPFGFAVSARHPARTVQEFAAWARARGTVDWASPVPGSMPHFIGTQLARLAGLSLNHVPYRGSAPAVQDLLAGTIQAVLLPIGELTAFHRSGDARLLAVTAPQRLPRLAEVPTFAEAGLADLTHEEWYGHCQLGGLQGARHRAAVGAERHAATWTHVSRRHTRKASVRARRY
jgi:tripartite-type tricarboxylate transporter receptor subunit TctC